MRKEGLDLVLQAAGAGDASGDEFASVWRPGMAAMASSDLGAPPAAPPPAW